jgi:diacylglycerol kinase (ATP)
MKLLFIVNPQAGGNDHTAILKAIELKAEQNGFAYEILYTKGENDKQYIERKISSFQPDRVIVGGGDGTLQLVARSLIPHDIAIGVLPMGSANGFATALGISNDPLSALDDIFQSTKIQKLDMLRFNEEHYCIHLADVGVNALMVKKYAEADDRGMVGYAKHLLSSIKEASIIKAIIRTMDSIINKEGYMMAFANAHKYGTGVQISEGSVSDGKFEICNVEKIALDDAIKAGLTILNVFIDKNMFSDVISCSEAEIEFDNPVHFQVDGEYIGRVNHLKIEILPATVNLLCK